MIELAIANGVVMFDYSTLTSVEVQDTHPAPLPYNDLVPSILRQSSI
jgi:hypothetical protein